MAGLSLGLSRNSCKTPARPYLFLNLGLVLLLLLLLCASGPVYRGAGLSSLFVPSPSHLPTSLAPRPPALAVARRTPD